MPVRIRIYGRQREGELSIVQSATVYAHLKEEAKKVAEYKQIIYELPNIEPIIENLDLTDKKNDFLVIHEWEDKFIYPDVNEDVLDQLEWLGYDNFQMAIIPILGKYISGGILLRFLLVGKENSTESEFNAYGLVNTEGFCPGIGNKLQKDSSKIFAEKLTTYDAVIWGPPDEKDPFCNILVELNGQIIKLRIRINYEDARQKINNYSELKESRFLGLVDKKNIYPRSIKKMITRAMLDTYQPTMADAKKQLYKNGLLLTFISLFVMILVPIFDSIARESPGVGTIVFNVIFEIVMFFFLIWGVSSIFEGLRYIRFYSRAVKLKVLRRKPFSINDISFEEDRWLDDISQLQKK